MWGKLKEPFVPTKENPCPPKKWRWQDTKVEPRKFANFLRGQAYACIYCAPIYLYQWAYFECVCLWRWVKKMGRDQ